MAFEDRPYYREPSGTAGNPLMWLLMGSVSAGRWFGIEVRIHASLIIVIVLTLLMRSGGPFGSVTFSIFLFTIVLLHEFGHCIASRMVGGNPTQIVMTPLGGAAFVDAPRRPWANFVAVLGGPLVNVIICIAAWAALVAIAGPGVISWNPIHLLMHPILLPNSLTAYFLVWIFFISYGLLLFNLWPIFPLDGGQLLQSLLWVKIGYYKATYFACITGMIGALVMGAWGIAAPSLLLILIAFSGFSTCLSLYWQLKASHPSDWEDEFNYSASIFGGNATQKRKRLSKWAMKRATKRAHEADVEQQKIDQILSKVSAHGMHSLTWREKRTLRKATARQREREVEASARRGW
jgi:Zn-dependent protease